MMSSNWRAAHFAVIITGYLYCLPQSFPRPRNPLQDLSGFLVIYQHICIIDNTWRPTILSAIADIFPVLVQHLPRLSVNVSNPACSGLQHMTEMRDVHRLTEGIDCAEHHCDAQPILRSGILKSEPSSLGSQVFGSEGLRQPLPIAPSPSLLIGRIQFAIFVLSRT